MSVGNFSSGIAGRHLILDANFGAYGAEQTNSVKTINDYLVGVTKVSGMTMAIPPVALKFPVDDNVYNAMDKMLNLGDWDPTVRAEIVARLRARDDGRLGGNGVSAVAVWVESHCALHSWVDHGYISLDLFSCKTYDVMPVIEFTKEFLGLTGGAAVVIDRFTNAPANVEQFVF